uniref:FAR1 domain-containing protein n=1 Tax=Davidia involucrata TaxID=16924 RepID=A0A5B7BNE6_DAVIN
MELMESQSTFHLHVLEMVRQYPLQKTFNLRPSIKTDCKAKINVIAKEDGRFIINRVYLDHNHALSLERARHFRCNKVTDSHVKKKLELLDLAGVTLSKNFHSLVVEAGGYENLPFGEKEYV